MIKLTIGSLFDGSGGFPLAGMMNGVTPVWASEIEPYPIAVTRSRFPNMKHYGDICDINGAAIEPVDIITAGSPCQDMSVAGLRAGIYEGKRSNLFFESIRIVKEMRKATNGKYPRFFVWENVPGAFSSDKGGAFQAVIEAVCSAKDSTVSIPQSKGTKWLKSGTVVGNGYSVAWRVFDAQYWGVPQRRARIYLVADFDSERAGEILFKPDSLRRNLQPSHEAGEEIAADAVGRADGSFGTVTLASSAANAEIAYDISPCLMARAGTGGNQLPLTAYALGSVGINGDISGTLDASYFKGCGLRNGIEREVVVYPSIARTTEARRTDGSFGAGFVIYEPASLLEENWQENEVKNALRAGASKSSHAVVYPSIARTTETQCVDGSAGTECLGFDMYNQSSTGEVTRTLKTPVGGDDLPVAVIALQGNGIDRSDTAGCNGCGWRENECYTPNTIDRPAVCFPINTMVATRWNHDDGRTTFGIGEDGDSQFTLGAAHEHAVAYSFDSLASNSMKSSNPNSGCREVDIAKCLDTFDPNPSKNQGGIAVVECYQSKVGALCGTDYKWVQQQQVDQGKIISYLTMQRSDEYTESEVASCQASRQYKSATDVIVSKATHPRKYIIRRLMPIECARLQGFQDKWGELAPYDGDAEFWESVRKTHAQINGKRYSPVKDLKKWYDKLHNDGAEYKMWGNGIALPCAEFIMWAITTEAYNI